MCAASKISQIFILFFCKELQKPVGLFAAPKLTSRRVYASIYIGGYKGYKSYGKLQGLQDNRQKERMGKNMKTTIRKHPAEMTTWEFLDEQLYQRTLRGGCREDWAKTRERLPSLGKYRNAAEFMKEMRKHRNLRYKTIRQLETLWRGDYGLRPATGTILMLALWRNAPLAGDDYWYRYFMGLAEAPTSSRDNPVGKKGGVPCEE